MGLVQGFNPGDCLAKAKPLVTGADSAGQQSTSTAARAAETESQMITFKSIGHFFASAFKKVITEAPAVETAISDSKTAVETVTAAVDPALVPIEDAGYAVLGEVAQVINAAGDAGAAKLADAGLDVNVINMVKALLASPAVASLAALAKKL